MPQAPKDTWFPGAIGPSSLTQLAGAVAPALDLLPASSGASAQVDVDQARRHGVLAMVGWPHDTAVESAVAASARQARGQNLESYVRALADLRVVSGALSSAGIDWGIVKGPELAADLYPRPFLRHFTDIDVVVPPPHFGAVLRALERVGGVVLVRNWDYMASVQPAQLAMRLPAGSLLDLHWHLVNHSAERHDFPLTAKVLLARASPSLLTETGSTPDPTLTFLHLAWHASHSGCARLVWACDIELASRRVANIDECVRAAEPLGLTTAVEIALRWTQKLFPQGRAAVLSAEWPRSPWGEVAARAVVLGQDGRLGRYSGQSLARWTRSTSSRSTTAWLRALPRILRPGAARVEDLWRGGEPARRAYVDAVERQF